MGTREEGVSALRRFLAGIIASYEDALVEAQVLKHELEALGWRESSETGTLREMERKIISAKMTQFAGTVGVTREDIESARSTMQARQSPFSN